MEQFQAPGMVTEWHDVYSVSLGELYEDGWIDWDSPAFDWSEWAYDAETYTRLCEGIVQRYYFRELSMMPPKRWQKKLMYRLRFELCPKYNRMYAKAESLNPLQESDEYGKSRDIRSAYPETLLSDNADYLESGEDHQHEDVKEGRLVELGTAYFKEWRDIDAAFLDELESLFSPLAAVGLDY